MSLPFPNVPFAAGVPPLPRSAAFPPVVTPPIGSQALPGQLWQSSQAAPVWGIFATNAAGQPTGNPVLSPDNFLTFGNRAEWTLPKAPIQQGSFTTYNKVIQPFDVSVRITRSGTLVQRTQFLITLDQIAASLNLYALVSPERIYTPVNILRYEVTRTEGKGAFFLDQIDIFFQQILALNATYSTTSTANTSNAQNPAAQPTTNQGVVAGQAPAAAASTAANAALAANPP